MLGAIDDHVGVLVPEADGAGEEIGKHVDAVIDLSAIGGVAEVVEAFKVLVGIGKEGGVLEEEGGWGDGVVE